MKKLIIVVLLLFLCGCTVNKVETINSYPTPPKCGPNVAKELRKICSPEEDCKYLIEFFQRYEKHYDILQSRIKSQESISKRK